MTGGTGPRARWTAPPGAASAHRLLGPEHRDLVLWHRRHYAAEAGHEPSALCWAEDKLHVLCDPLWLYIPRAVLSDEIDEYRHEAAAAGFVPLSASHREWYGWLRRYLREVAVGRCAVPARAATGGAAAAGGRP